MKRQKLWPAVCIFVCLLTPALPSAVGAPAALPMSTAAYDAQLARVQADLQAALADNGPKPAARALSDLAPVVQRPVVFQSTLVNVDNRPLRSTMTRIDTFVLVPHRHEMLLDLINQVILIRAGMKGEDQTTSAENASGLAKSVLRGNQFASDPIAPPTALQRTLIRLGDEFYNWLRKWLKKFHGPSLGPLPEMRVDPNIARGILIGIFALALVLLVSLIVRALISFLEGRKLGLSPGTGLSGLAMTEEEEALISSGDYARLILIAKQNASLAEYRNAYRLVYLAALVLLDTTGDIRINRSWTNWEYLRHIETEGRPETYGHMAPLTANFDRIWYGYGKADDRAFDEAVSAFEKIQSTARAVASSRKASV